MARRGGSPRLVALLGALLWALVILVIARTRYGSDVRGLLIIGEGTPVPPALVSVPTAGPSGYDAPKYAALATDPFLRYLDTPHYLDSPSYRATRIMAPALAWALALGNPAVAVVLYQLLCWGLAIAAVYVMARWLAEQGRSPWWALPAATSAGVAAAVVRSTPDAVAVFFMLAALWLHSRGRPAVALVLVVSAVLTRETSLLAAVALAADSLRRRRFATAAAFAALPASAAVAWQLYLRHIFGRAFDTGAGNFAAPFAWLPSKLRELTSVPGLPWYEAFGLVAIFLTTAAFFAVAPRPRTWSAAELTFLGFSGMGLFLGHAVYAETWAYSRALIAVPFLAPLISGRRPGAWRTWLLRSVVLFYALAGLAMVRDEVAEALDGRALLPALIHGTPPARPRTTPAPCAGLPSRPAQGERQVVWVMPAARVQGRSGADWATRLEIENPNSYPVRVELALHQGAGERYDRFRTVIALEPHERRRWEDAIGGLFGEPATGALRIRPERGRVVVRSLTEDVSLTTRDAALWPAMAEGQGVPSGGRARFTDLAHERAHEAGVRTNIGVLNLSDDAITVRIEAFDDASHPIGRIAGRLHPHGFTQVDDIFAKLRAGRIRHGSARLSTATPGAAFLAYAAVIRGGDAPVAYQFCCP